MEKIICNAFILQPINLSVQITYNSNYDTDKIVPDVDIQV